MIAIGVAFLCFKTMNLEEPVRNLIFSWQMIVCVLGVVFIAFRNLGLGLACIFTAIVFALPLVNVAFPQLLAWSGITDFGIHNTWTLLLIAGGILALLHVLFPKYFGDNRMKHIRMHTYIHSQPQSEDNYGRYQRHHYRHSPNNFKTSNNSIDSVFDINVVFNGVRHIVMSQKLEGGDVNVVFGEAQVDLHKATLSPNGAFLDLNCVFGHILLIVPEDWQISYEPSAILGATTDKREVIPPYDPDKPTLKITGSSVMGAIEMVNY